MRIQDLAGKNICILGYGREGRAMADAIVKHAAGAEITVADQNDTVDIPGEYWAQLGTGWLQNLGKFDVIIVSPGIPPKPEIAAVEAKVTTATQIFFDSVADSGAVIVGVTGSKGKSTTSSLIHAILKADGRDSHLVGNIGEPAVSHLDDAKAGTVFVHELSSYQLMRLTRSPKVAVVTAFFPEHLDYHGSYEAYLEAKKHIARFQGKDDTVIYAGDMPQTEAIAKESRGKKIKVSAADAPVKLEEMLIKGKHNLSNAAAAWKAAELLGVKKAVAADAIKHFKGLPHRLESIGVFGGLEWVNDSISTTPESAVAALDALGDDVHTIILGGQDRGYDFSPLAERIASSEVKTVVLLPDSGIIIGKAIERMGAPVLLVQAKDMQEAVTVARTHTEQGIVVLSPASPSYGHFRNFEDRGEQFRAAVKDDKNK